MVHLVQKLTFIHSFQLVQSLIHFAANDSYLIFHLFQIIWNLSVNKLHVGAQLTSKYNFVKQENKQLTILPDQAMVSLPVICRSLAH